MKNITKNPFLFKILIRGICLSGLIAGIPALGDYQVNRYTVDSGGGQSAGGQYSITGTIGQPYADYSEGEKYELLSGFWPGGPLCFVDLEDFAGFADYWLETGADLPADFDKDNDVDFNDLSILLHDWLCLCPYDWPLR